MSPIDHVLAFILAIAWPVSARLGFGRFVRDLKSGRPGALLAGYSTDMLTQWLMVSVIVVWWIARAGDRTALGVAVTPQAIWPMVVAASLSAFLIAQCLTVARRPETHSQVRAEVTPIAVILPTRRSDLTGFLALSVTAGICEEFLFRGYLPWGLGQWASPWVAQGIAVAMFAVMHGHLGRKAAIQAGVAGLVCAVLYLWSGSL